LFHDISGQIIEARYRAENVLDSDGLNELRARKERRIGIMCLNKGSTIQSEITKDSGALREDYQTGSSKVVERHDAKGRDQRKQKRLGVQNMNMRSEIPLARKVSIINISSGGVLVKTDRRINIGNTYLLKIGYKDKLLLARAVVKWSLLVQSIKKENSNISPLYMAGLHFREDSPGNGEGIIESIMSDLEADAAAYIEHADNDCRDGQSQHYGDSAAQSSGIGSRCLHGTADEESPHTILGKIEAEFTRHTGYNLTYYELLEINDTAQAQEIKKAYYKKVKEFHPDRHFSLPRTAKEKLNVIFTHLHEAYETLMHDDQKEQYDRTLVVKHTLKISNQELAHQYFEQGKIEFWNSNFTAAEILFQHALYLDNSLAKYFYYHAKSLLKLEKFREAEKAIRKALKLSPANSDFLTEAGYIYHALGLSARAEENFGLALGIEPSHAKARQGMQGIRDSRRNNRADEHLFSPAKVFKKILTR
jgi:Flp pilus assembly protein TadD